MSAPELLDLLRAGEVTLFMDGDALRYRATPGAYTPELRALVAEHRAAVLAHFASRCPDCASRCPDCARPLKQGRCWRCGYRKCADCWRNTHALFVQLCLLCEAKERGLSNEVR